MIFWNTSLSRAEMGEPWSTFFSESRSKLHEGGRGGSGRKYEPNPSKENATPHRTRAGGAASDFAAPSGVFGTSFLVAPPPLARSLGTNRKSCLRLQKVRQSKQSDQEEFGTGEAVDTRTSMFRVGAKRRLRVCPCKSTLLSPGRAVRFDLEQSKQRLHQNADDTRAQRRENRSRE